MCRITRLHCQIKPKKPSTFLAQMCGCGSAIVQPRRGGVGFLCNRRGCFQTPGHVHSCLCTYRRPCISEEAKNFQTTRPCISRIGGYFWGLSMLLPSEEGGGLRLVWSSPGGGFELCFCPSISISCIRLPGRPTSQ